MSDNYDDHGAELAAKDAEIEQLRKERDSAFETWKAMHVATLNGFIKQHHEPLKTEIDRLRDVMRRVANELGRENEGLVEMIREALGDE